MSVSLDKLTISPADAGCWLDGAMGWHNTYRVWDRAVEYGMTETEDERAIVSAYADQYVPDTVVSLPSGETIAAEDLGQIVHDMADDATNYLQSKAPEGYVFVWDAGELMLLSVSEADMF